MKIIPRLALILLLIAPSWAWAQIFVSDETHLKDLPPMFVKIHDNATDGCWTNIKEVKDYAEGKLEIAGANLNYTGDKQFVPWDYEGSVFSIIVISERDNNLDFCYANMSAKFRAGSKSVSTELLGMQVYSTFELVGVNQKNMNRMVLDMVQKAIAEWENRK